MRSAPSPAVRERDFKALLTMSVHGAGDFDLDIDGRRMEILVTAALAYVAIGAAFFAHPASPAQPDDFHWRGQIDGFRATPPDGLAWPPAPWPFCRSSLRPVLGAGPHPSTPAESPATPPPQRAP